MNIAYLLLGSNDGDRMEMLHTAIKNIEQTCGQIAARSRVYETAAWGLAEQPDFLNMAVAIHTRLIPEELLTVVNRIEKR